MEIKYSKKRLEVIVNLDVSKFKDEGYLGPFKLYDQAQAEDLLSRKYISPKCLTWYKSPHERSMAIVKAAMSVAQIGQVQSLIGSENVLLWGSHYIAQHPGRSHGWHLDVEYGAWNGITAWLGLKNLDNNTSVSLITRSHLLGKTPGMLNKEMGVDLNDDKAMLREAQKLDNRCELRTLYLRPGEFIVWAGRVWHTTLNNSVKTRHSIIMQYCDTEQRVKIPLNYEYPDTKWSEEKPPCVLISGVDNFEVNRRVTVEEIEVGERTIPFIKSKLHMAREVLSIVKNRKYL